MNKKTLGFLATIVALLIVLLLFSHDRFQSHSPTNKASATVDKQKQGADQARDFLEIPTASPKAVTSSNPWKPNVVFSKLASPTPAIVFPRGKNAERRYHVPVTVELPKALASNPPAVLAKTPQDGRLHLLPEEIDEHTLVARRMVFDPASLDQIIAGKTNRLLVPTTDDEVLTLEFDKIKTRSATTHTLQGHVVGKELTTAQFVYHDGILHGEVMDYPNQEELEYRILADGYMQVGEPDHSATGHDCATCNGDMDMADSIQEEFGEVSPPKEITVEGEIVSRDTPGWRTIDMVIGYGFEVRQVDGGYAQIEARIISSVDRLTTAFANSQVANTEVMLLGTIEEPDYVFPGAKPANMVEELSNLANLNDGVLDIVSDYGTRLGADLMSFVISSTEGGVSGIARFANRYTIVVRGAMSPSGMVLEHEVGHNLGLAHAWGDSAVGPGSNKGWRFKTTGGAQLSTIMAYTDGWGARVPYYSNPNIFYDGARIGAVDGYNATGDPTVDPRLVVGGLRFGPTDYGYDGNTPTLGANNALAIDTGVGGTNFGATVASNWAVRTNFEVVNPPAVGAQWELGTTQIIRFNGGDHKDTATIQLFKGGVLHSTLASGLNPATQRDFTWVVPFDLTAGSDYMIRVELDRNGSTLIADSGMITLYSDPPNVTIITAPAVPAIYGQISNVVFTFNVPMDPASFSIGSDILSFTDPIGTSLLPSITGATWSAGNTVLTVQFAPPSQPGDYQLVLSPNIADTNGALIDQDGDGVAAESMDDRVIAAFTVNPPLIYSANMDTNPGWTFSANNPATNGWAYGQPTGQGANPYRNNDPTSGFTGPNVVGYNLTGDYQNNIPDTRWATTPAFNCSNHENVTLSFKRWLGMNYNDFAYIQVSNNGSSWTTVWQGVGNTNSVNDNAWFPFEYDISAVADGQATVYVRWGLGLTGADINGGASGWNIDDVLVYGTVPENLAVTPAGTLDSSGVEGGPFSPSSIQYTVQNTGSGTLQWTAQNSANWVTVSPSSGTLTGGASATVTVAINSQAEVYAVGAYSDLVTFTNATTGTITATRAVDLDVLGPGKLVVDPIGDFAADGVVGGPFSPTSMVYTLSNGGITPIVWGATKSQAWLTLSATSGTLNPGQSTTVTVSLNSNADVLSAGTHTDAVSFYNNTNENGDTSRGVSLTVYPLATNLYWDANGSIIGAKTSVSGTWGTSSFWNTNPTGGAGTFSSSTSVTSDLFIVAGPAANSGTSGNITVNGTRTANSITHQHSGNITFSGGTSITLGNGTAGQGGITLNEFAFGTTVQGNVNIATPLILNNSQTWTNNKVDPDYRQLSSSLNLTGTSTAFALNHALTIAGKGVTSLSANTNTTITGTGGITKNGTGTLILSTKGANNSGWSGGLTVNGGLVRYQNLSNFGTSNINLAGGILEGNSVSTPSSLTALTLGADANQIRITGGVSGFSAQNGTGTIFTIAGTNPLVWGSAHFAPTEFVLQAATAQPSTIATFTNGFDLNNGTRTIRSDQPKSPGSGGYATLSGSFTGTGNLIKTGSGHIFLTATGSQNYGGTTLVSQGTLSLDNIFSISGRDAPGMITVSPGATLGVRLGGWGATSIDNLRANVTWSDISSQLGLYVPGSASTSSTYARSITQTLSIHKYGGGIIVLSGNSSFPGTTRVSEGTVSFNSIANVGGGNSALGAPTTVANGTIQLGGLNSAVGLRYTGTGHTSDRLIALSGSTSAVTLNASGSGAWVHTGNLVPTFPTTANGQANKTLTLTGNSTAGNTLAGTIPDTTFGTGTNTLTLSKTDVGTWILGGDNTYTGTTTVGSGKLFINGNQSTAIGNVSVSNNATLGGTGVIGGNTTITAGGMLEFNLSTAAASHDKLELADTRTLTFSGASTLTIASSGGAAPGSYVLLTAPGGISGSAPATLNLPVDWAATVGIVGNDLILTVTSVGAGVAADLAVTTAENLSATGPAGGGFSPSSIDYTLNNPGTTSIDWTVEKSATWMDLSATSGTLAPGGSVIVTVSINSNANALGLGEYVDTITFLNQSTGFGNTIRTATLNVLGAGTLDLSPAGGFASSGVFGGPFTPASNAYTLTNGGVTTINWTASNTAGWVTLDVTGGTLAPSESVIVTASINGNANTLGLGTYGDTISFFNSTNGQGDTTRAVTLTVNPTPATVTLGNLTPVYDGTPKSVSVTTNPLGLAQTVTYNGSATAPTNAGTYAVVATITDPSYSGSASGSLVIDKASQTITFDPLGTVALSGSPIPLTATASSGLAVSYSSSNTAVATISGSNLNTLTTGTSTITASQAGNANYNPATSVQQGITVSLLNPVANAGGPYQVLIGGPALALNGSASQPSGGASITSYAWDLDGDLDYDDASGVNPTAISYNDLVNLWGMGSGLNTIRLQVTDSEGKTATGTATVELIDGLSWDANAAGAGQTDGGAVWLNANQWWDGATNKTWTSGLKATFGRGGTGGNVTLASPTSVKSLVFNSFTSTYNLGSTSQTITLAEGITMTGPSGAVTLTSPIALSGPQTWTNNAADGALQLLVKGAVNNSGFDLTIDGSSVAPTRTTGNVRIAGVMSGAGGLIKNGPGVLWLQAASTHSGPTTVNGGILRNQVNSLTGLPSGNITLNGGVIEAYWSNTFTRALGTGTNQIQITGGASGFSQNANNTLNVKLGNTNTPIQWGSSYFNPTKLVLQEYTGDTNALTDFQNFIDLNGANRTIEVNGNPLVNARAQMSGVISGTAGIIKTGNGLLTLTVNNTYNGNTTVNAGTLRLNVANTNNQSSTVSIAAGATLHLGFSGTDTVDKLFVDGTQLAAGVYKAVGSAASGTELSALAGTGTLTVVSDPPTSPVDHFVISTIASPQTRGTAITGITMTAQDAANATATSFTGTVSFGGTAGITGTSVNFVAGVLSGVSVTPNVAGSNLTFTVDDGAGHTGTATFTVRSLYEVWAGTEGLAGGNAVTAANPDGDSLSNLQEYAFGMDPESSTLNPLTYVANGTATPGVPILENLGTNESPNYRAVFGRRKDYVAAGLTYSVEFSANLTYWKPSAVGLTVLSGTSGSVIDAVAVPFPATVPLTPAETEQAPPRFFRVINSDN